LLNDLWAEYLFISSFFWGENSEPLLCKLEDGVIYNDGLRMAMLNGDPLLKRVTEIIDRLVEAGIYNFWISRDQHLYKVLSH